MIDLSIPVKIFDSLEIELVIQGAAARFPTRVEDISDDLIWVDPPMHKLRSFLLPVGQAVRLRCATPLGIHTTRTVVRQVRSGPLQLLGLDALTPWDRVQQRQDVRVDVMLRPGVLEHVPQEVYAMRHLPPQPAPEKAEPETEEGEGDGNKVQDEEQPKAVPIKGMVMNLSAGGMMLATEYALTAGSIVFISFDLSPVATQFEAYGRVVRIEKRGEGTKIRAGVQFLEMKSRQQQVLVRYVFHRARELRGRGVI